MHHCATPVRLCIGNNDESFLPLVYKHEGVFKNANGMSVTFVKMYLTSHANYINFVGTQVVAYYEQQTPTIRHVKCQRHLPPDERSQRCHQCKKYRYVLHSMLARFKVPLQTSRCLPSSHTNIRHLRPLEKDEKIRQLKAAYSQQAKKVKRLELSLSKLNATDGILVDNATNKDLLTILNHNTDSTENSRFQTIFWEQQLKAKTCKESQGVRWHPAIIRWCLYLHHRSSGAYSTLRKSGVITLPSERTLRDYRHFCPSTTGFSKDCDLQLLDLLQYEDQNLGKYVTIVIDEMYIKEGLAFDKTTGSLIGFSDLGDVNNLFAEYEQKDNAPKRLAKVMMTLMVRGLFTSLKYIYAQFPAVSTKGADIFTIIWKAIHRLTRLGLVVVAITCDGASNNRKMFDMHGLTNGLPYKTINVYDSKKQNIYFICDPPHLIKTIRNCFARGHLWVSILLHTTFVPHPYKRPVLL